MRYGTVVVVALVAFALGISIGSGATVVEARNLQTKGWKGGLRVQENIDSGKYMCLSDGSIWETNSVDRLNVSLWLMAERVAVVDDERLVPEAKSARATKIKPNTLVPRRGERAGGWLRSKTGSGRFVELNDGTLWEVGAAGRMDARLWMTMDRITVTDDVKLTNTSKNPSESVQVQRLK